MTDNFTTLTKRLDSLNARFDAMVAREDAQEFKKGDRIRVNRQGAPVEIVSVVYPSTLVTDKGNEYHKTKVVRADADAARSDDAFDNAVAKIADKTYSSRSAAERAARDAGFKEFAVHNSEDGWFISVPSSEKKNWKGRKDAAEAREDAGDLRVEIKTQHTNEENISRRTYTYDVYVNGKFDKMFHDILDAIDYKEKLLKEAKGRRDADERNPAWKKFKVGQSVEASLMKGAWTKGTVKSLDQNGTHVKVEVNNTLGGGTSVYNVHHGFVRPA